MEPQFVDRILTCSDCHGEFIFTAGEQLFFHDKQFKNDPKRCKGCKSRRSGLSAGVTGGAPAAAGLARTETRTECSECGIQTTVPFKPTQGRPVLCRQCFQAKARVAASRSAETILPAVAATAVQGTAAALQDASSNASGAILSPDAAVLAAASMASASPQSSIATAADLASISPSAPPLDRPEQFVPASLVVAAAQAEVCVRGHELQMKATEQPEA